MSDISNNIEYFQQSCELLWKLAVNEMKQTDSKSNYSVTILAGLAKYELYKPFKFYFLILDFIERQLKCSNDYNSICSLLDILDPMLEKEGLANRLTGSEINFTPFLVSYDKTKEIRRKTISLIRDYLTSESTKVAFRALTSLSKALNPPTGFFGKEVSADETNKWLSEQMEILNIIETISKTTKDPLVKIQIKSSLDWPSRQSKQPTVADKANSIIGSLPESYDSKFMRAIWYNYDWDYEDFEKRQKNILQEMEEVAKEFLEKCNYDDKQVFDALDETITKFKVNEIPIHPGDFLRILSAINIETAYNVCNCIISNKSSLLTLYFGSLLSGIREKEYDMAIELTQIAVDSCDPVLCRSISEGYAHRGWAFGLKNEEINIVKKLLGCVEADIRILAIESLGRFPKTLENEAFELALNIEIGDDEKLADAYCSIFNEHGISLEKLDAKKLETIIKKLSKIKKLDEHLYHLNVFLAHCSAKIPEELIDFFLERLDLYQNFKSSSNSRFQPLPYSGLYRKFKSSSNSRFQPLPYSGFSDNELKGVSLSPNYKKILRKVRDRSLNKDLTDSFWLPMLYSYISENFSFTSLEVLNEWVNTKNEEKIKAVGLLVKEAPSNFVFLHSDFISNIITNSQAISNDCYIEVRSDLSNSALYGVRTGIHGQPCNQDEELRDRAQEFMEKYQLGSPTWDFYNWLYNRAKGSINAWLERDEEMLEE